MNKRNINNPFRQQGGNQVAKTQKELEWGKVKFNPVAKTATMEQATPWAHFKSDIIKQNQNEKQELKLKNVANSQEIFKKREENYRRNLITSKRNQPTQWEDFSDEKSKAVKSTKKPKTDPLGGHFQKIESKIKNIESIRKDDFDSRLLTTDQNTYLKRYITKQTCIQKGVSLKQAVKNMKVNGVIKNKAKRFGEVQSKKFKTK